MSDYSIAFKVLNKINELKSLNILLSEDVFQPVQIKDQASCYAYKAMAEDLKSDIAKTFGFEELPGNRSVCLLALAITQEDQNEFISHSQIKTVNDFFEFINPITFDEVQEFSSRYI